MYDYMEEMKEDIKNYLEEHKDYIDADTLKDKDYLWQELNDACWMADDVTGNASGSYTFNSYKAKEYVTENMDYVLEMVREFCIDSETVAEKFLNEEWEWFDVSVRCYLLGQAITEVLDEMEENGFFDEEEEEENPVVEVLENAADTIKQAATMPLAATIRTA